MSRFLCPIISSIPIDSNKFVKVIQNRKVIIKEIHRNETNELLLTNETLIKSSFEYDISVWFNTSIHYDWYVNIDYIDNDINFKNTIPVIDVIPVSTTMTNLYNYDMYVIYSSIIIISYI
jgi:hypothetical protein